MTTAVVPHFSDELIDAWADAESAYETFMAQHELIDVRMMSEPDYEAWKKQYCRLSAELIAAQLAAYGAMRAEGS